MGLPIGPLTILAKFDAVACGGEFVDRFPKPDALEYRQHTMWPYSPAGEYSDDTQFTLAVAEWMLDGNRPAVLEDFLVNTWQRDPRGGSPRMQAAFEEAIGTGKPFSECLGVKTDGSGAAMRASLFGLRAWPMESVLQYSALQAKLTHSGDGVLAAQAAALMVWLTAWGDCPKEELGMRIASILNDSRFHVMFRPPKPSNKGMDCVIAALWALRESSTLTQIMQHVLDMGGDTDTVAVIAAGAAWMSPQWKHDLDYKWWFKLENGPYGRAYLRKIELELLGTQMFKHPKTGEPLRLRTE